ncbi:MAG: hypothetical protein M3N53_06260 [Actinomycetota bacterium]|nr:hypothetical protein [Actinomycetota bacterium]
MKKVTRVRTLLLATAAIVLSQVGASAHLGGHSDPDDVGGKLDMRRVEISPSGRHLTVTVRTHDRFHRDDLEAQEQGFHVRLDSRRDRRWDFTLLMNTEHTVPECTLYARDGFTRYGNRGTKRPRSMSCSFPRADLNQTRHLRWKVRSYDFPNEDFAPNRGWYRH